MQETRASLRNLEVQMGQIATEVVEINQRSTITLHSNTIPNPGEEYKAIIVVSGQVASIEAQVTEKPIEKETPKEVQSKEEHAISRHSNNPFLVDLEKYPALPKAPEYEPKMPYPQRLQKETKDKQLSKFLEVFKKLQINIPFDEALEQMPLYVKFMKDILSKKRALWGDETMVLTKKCSAIIQSNLPKKMSNLGSFQISCTIGSTTFEKALCDLGASINLMPLSVMKKLQIK
ncbi:hypothetical protein AHAS_Ahas18G0191700 [Arachis hypogaea]